MLDELIYDRTQADVDLIKLEPTNENTKGTLNYYDLNRIEVWLGYLKYLLADVFNTDNIVLNLTYKNYQELTSFTYEELALFNYFTVCSKGNWSLTDIPDYANIKRIVEDSEILKKFYESLTVDIEEIKFTITLNYKQLNSIENILFLINNIYITQIKNISYYKKCGLTRCGSNEL